LHELVAILVVLVIEEVFVLVLVVVGLGEIAFHVKLGHLLAHLNFLAGLFGFFLLLLALLFLLFLELLLLGAVLEGLEDVLIVEQSVGKLLHEGVLLEVALDPGLDERALEEVGDGGASIGVADEDLADEGGEGLGEGGGDPIEAAGDDAFGELVEGAGVEGRAEGAHFVEEDAEGPDVGLEGVGLVLDDLGREVVGGADDSFGVGAGVGEDARNAEVA